MINRTPDGLEFECDSCDETLATEKLEFRSAWMVARRQGWKARKIGHDWVHGCERCGV